MDGIFTGLVRTVRHFHDDFITDDAGIVRKWDSETYEYRPDEEEE